MDANLRKLIVCRKYIKFVGRGLFGSGYLWTPVLIGIVLFVFCGYLTMLFCFLVFMLCIVLLWLMELERALWRQKYKFSWEAMYRLLVR